MKHSNMYDESGTLLDEDLDLLINDIANDTSAILPASQSNNEQAILDIDILNT
jgi:hypothetical protein